MLSKLFSGAQERDFLRILGWVTPPRRTLMGLLALLALAALLSLVHPLLAGALTAKALGAEAMGDIPLAIILFLWMLLLVMQALLQVATTTVSGNASEGAIAALRQRIYDHMQALPLGYHNREAPGQVLSLLANDAEQLSYLVTETLMPLLPALLTFAGALALLCWISPMVGLLALVLVPLYFLLMKLLGRRLRPLAQRWNQAYATMFAAAEENLKLLPVIKSFTREAHETDRFRRANAGLLDLSRRQVAVDALLTPVTALAAGGGMLLLLGLGVSSHRAGALSAPELVSLLLYARMLVQPVSILAGGYGQVQRARGAVQRLAEFFSVAAEPVIEGDKRVPNGSSSLEFQSVDFAYASGEPVLRRLNLGIAAGERVAITGVNGSGKSTLVYLLQRFADPAAGRILLGGEDIRDYPLRELRRHIGVVAQNTLLLNSTIAQNIAFADPGASAAQIEHAARLAQVDHFVATLPEGYNTIIGDQGLRLSGGQRQRLALARVLLKDPPLLILDEATSMFDRAAEEEFVALGEQVLQGRTVLIISHRPASLALAQRQVAIEQLMVAAD
jgi:ATP-binding cassette subfamily B protein